MPFTGSTSLVIVVGLGVVVWFVWLRRAGRPGEIYSLAVFELVWLLSFLAYLWFRAGNSAIANTEKPMEIAFLSAIMRSDSVPAPDPWFAGEAINYYYLGYQALATVGKIAGVPPSIVFNLGLATLFASLVTVAAGIGARLARMVSGRWSVAVLGGFVTTLFVALSGNLETPLRLSRAPRATIDAGWWDGVGWQASRVIVDEGVGAPGQLSETINEFPAFSFVLGDLHPHLLAYPWLFSIVALAIGFALIPSTLTLPRVAAAGALAGLLYAANSWDAPLALLIVLLGVLVAGDFDWRSIWRPFVAASVGAVLAALPFVLHFTAPVGVRSEEVPEWLTRLPVIGTLVNTFAVVTWRPSGLGELLIVHGAWLAFFCLFAGWALWSRPNLRALAAEWQAALVVVGLVATVLALVWAPALLLIGAPLVVSAFLARRDDRPTVRLVAGLYAIGFGLALVPEFFFIQDVFGDRMNTVFKLFFQAWLFLALASAGAVVLVSTELRGLARRFTLAGCVLLTTSILTYTPLSVADWLDMRVGPRTLDGAAYLAEFNPGDAEALAWVSSRAQPGDVIVESPGCAYGTFAGIPMSRFSAFSGLSTVVGWPNHESQWRRGEQPPIGPRLDQRVADANDWLSALAVQPEGYPAPRFLIVGPQETEGSSTCPLLVPRGPGAVGELEAVGWVVAFQSGSTTVLVRSDDSLALAAFE
jgi:YYY domain-containing protein